MLAEIALNIISPSYRLIRGTAVAVSSRKVLDAFEDQISLPIFGMN